MFHVGQLYFLYYDLDDENGTTIFSMILVHIDDVFSDKISMVNTTLMLIIDAFLN